MSAMAATTSHFGPSGGRANVKRANTRSSIRGRISGPIPITVENGEFPMRSRGTSIATPFGAGDIDKQLRISKSHMSVHYELPLSSDRGELSRPLVPQEAQAIHPSEALAGGPYESNVERPKRKRSSLRSVLGRLFGRKKSHAPVQSSAKTTEPGRGGHHNSDPTALRESFSREVRQPRSASMPINEFNTALSSHAIFTIDHQRIGDPTQLNKRTTQDTVETPLRIAEPVDWTGLRPRPASSHARSSRLFLDDTLTPNERTTTHENRPHRRSRSLTQLKDATTIQTNMRRRSDEIRFWRESYDPEPLSPLLSLKHDGGGLVTSAEKEVPQGENIAKPPEPFNFGPMGEMAGMKITQAASIETRVSRLEERLENMERAVEFIHNQISGPLPQYRQGGHARVYQKRSSNFSLPQIPLGGIYKQLHNPRIDTKNGSQLYDNSSRPSTKSTQQPSHNSPDNPSFHSNFSTPPGLNALSDSDHDNLAAEFTESMGRVRPLSTSTTIHVSPARCVPRGTLTADHYTALVNLIQAEAAARATLETRVTVIQHQVESILERSFAPRPDNIANLSSIGIARSEISSFNDGSDEESDEERSYDNDEIYHLTTENGNQFGAEGRYDRGEMVGGVEGYGQGRTLSLSKLTLLKRA